MSYFITGATGFIGRYLVKNLLVNREDLIYVLVRESSLSKVENLKIIAGDTHNRIVPIVGDIEQESLGVSKKDQALLTGKIKHFFHLAAIYDLSVSEDKQQVANVEGTRQAVYLAAAIASGMFHHISSIAAAGLYRGTFREDMFEEAENLNNPYLRTKHEAELIVREECQIPYRIYRPGMVVGHSKTGEIGKIDGPYFVFKLIQKLRKTLPPWMPTIGIEGGRLNIVPVDFVADALDHIAHKGELPSNCFHLVDPEPHKVGEVMNIFCRAGHAPEMAMRIDSRLFGFIPPFIKMGFANLPPVKRITEQLLKDLGIPRDTLSFINYPTKFDARETERALADSTIRVPRLESYAANVWDYWERNLDPDLHKDISLSGAVTNKVVVVTGASSGIGKAAALMLGEAGAQVVICARTKEDLEAVQLEIQNNGGKCAIYTCDLANLESCDQLIDDVLRDYGQIDVLVNNAGRSIRRSVAHSYDRFHDFERTMQLNYFGALRLIMRALPAMSERHSGHIINISSIGVLTNAPRFSAYVASKSALDSFTRCAASEFSDLNIAFTTINMPLVRTPMIAPTKIYDSVPAISPEEAADFIGQAIIFKPKRIATRLGIFGQVMHYLMPKNTEIIMNMGFKMFPDSPAATGEKDKPQPVSSEQIAFATLMSGIHW